jgi:hypothetical protein
MTPTPTPDPTLHALAARVEGAEGDGLRAAKLHILQHSLGVDQFGQGDQYRNHFVTGEDSVDYDNCMALVSDGLMRRRDGAGLPFGGDHLFHVTDAGKKFVAEYSPKPPKLTASQKRYQAYLDADSNMSFGEWLARSTTKGSSDVLR